MRIHLLPFAALLAACLAAAPAARAGLFDDSEARQRITDLKTASEQRFDTLSKAILDLQTKLLGQQEEIARLKGALETLSYQHEQLARRVQDYYNEHEERLRRLESSGGSGNASSGGSAAVEVLTDTQAYEAALNLFKAGKYAEAAKAFERFGDNFPDSDIAPNAMFWLGNAFYALNNCKDAISAQETVLSRWPSSPRVPDAMLAIADCQRDKGNTTAARSTLNALANQYPKSQAAVKAKERLAQLR
ncbi:MAG: tol-pal system protein YbgF [Zoogloeaceae bacterium]|jgi:tol-pal system protein YbgF|nr:tol-pal system protein YbgF [Zoogloeaceae bacterium]